MVDIEILYRVQVLSIERIFDRMGPGLTFALHIICTYVGLEGLGFL